jgi:hypothetical protein
MKTTIRKILEKAALSSGVSETKPSMLAGDFHGDGITIFKAEYKTEDQELTVEANSIGQPSDKLYIENYGAMVWDCRKVKYLYKVKEIPAPGDVVAVISDFGGLDFKNVNFKS